MNPIFNKDGFNWWIGVVEDRNDPEKLGRCRVRIFGYHTDDKEILKTEDLPWAFPIQPITSAANSGVGSSPLGPLPGTWIFGFFLDGNDMQQPAMLGSMGMKAPKKGREEDPQKEDNPEVTNKKQEDQNKTPSAGGAGTSTPGTQGSGPGGTSGPGGGTAPSGGPTSSKIYAIGDSHTNAIATVGKFENLATNGRSAFSKDNDKAVESVEQGSTAVLSLGANDYLNPNKESVSRRINDLIGKLKSKNVKVYYMLPAETDVPKFANDSVQLRSVITKNLPSGVEVIDIGKLSATGKSDGIHPPGSFYANAAKSIKPNVASSPTGAGKDSAGNPSKAGKGTPDVPGWTLGQTSEKYESGGKGPGVINDYKGSAKGDNGGASYGTYQFASFLPPINAGTGKARPNSAGNACTAFVNSSRFSEKFKGLEPATDAFDKTWKEIAATDTATFKKDQHDYIQKKFYDVYIANLKRQGLDLTKFGPGVQDLAWSTCVQFGVGATSIFTTPLKDKSQLTDKDIINLVSDYKIATVDQRFGTSSAGIREGARNRFKREREDCLKLCKG